MTAGLDPETLDIILSAISEFAERELPESRIIALDEQDEFPADTIHEMCGGDFAVQLLFIDEAYGGMGGGRFDIYRVCERLARIDLGVATSVLATFLGSDPITVGGTAEQKKDWMTRIAADGLLMAYAATEPEAGSDLGALKTVAVPVREDGVAVGYRITGQKQWISNGGVADLYSVLANTPGGPSWFVLEKGAANFTHGEPEDKHGIRLSNTASLYLDDVYVDANDLVGQIEGQGLVQAQQVFGYTRLMVGAFGLGAGWAALDRAIPYSAKRIQGGAPLSEKQGYTHKLIVPHAARLEAARAYIEQTAEQFDNDEGTLTTEGAIAKYLATEAGNAAADAAIQALGGYGYTHEYLVEKIKRDVRITTIYEGTSEIMEMTIGRDRWQQHLKTAGHFYHDRALRLEEVHDTDPASGAGVAALAHHALGNVLEACRVGRLTRNQHILLRLGELVAWTECAGALAERVARDRQGTLSPKADRRFSGPGLATLSRIFAREAALKVATDGLRWVHAGRGADPDFQISVGLPGILAAQAGLIDDMDAAAAVIYSRAT
ncbi:MAG: acyl-CoA dehydrogenase family protein [Acidimicrobiales bacterium]